MVAICSTFAPFFPSLSGGAPRRHLYTAPERGEREDLYISMVLVHHPHGAHDHNINLSHRYYIFTADARLFITTEI